MENAKVTLAEAFIGLLSGVLIGFFMAVIMDRFEKMYQALYPLVVLTQTHVSFRLVGHFDISRNRWRSRTDCDMLTLFHNILPIS